jgi:hypothetical protein
MNIHIAHFNTDTLPTPAVSAPLLHTLDDRPWWYDADLM